MHYKILVLGLIVVAFVDRAAAMKKPGSGVDLQSSQKPVGVTQVAPGIRTIGGRFEVGEQESDPFGGQLDWSKVPSKQPGEWEQKLQDANRRFNQQQTTKIGDLQQEPIPVGKDERSSTNIGERRQGNELVRDITRLEQRDALVGESFRRVVQKLGSKPVSTRTITRAQERQKNVLYTQVTADTYAGQRTKLIKNIEKNGKKIIASGDDAELIILLDTISKQVPSTLGAKQSDFQLRLADRLTAGMTKDEKQLFALRLIKLQEASKELMDKDFTMPLEFINAVRKEVGFGKPFDALARLIAQPKDAFLSVGVIRRIGKLGPIEREVLASRLRVQLPDQSAREKAIQEVMQTSIGTLQRRLYKAKTKQQTRDACARFVVTNRGKILLGIAVLGGVLAFVGLIVGLIEDQAVSDVGTLEKDLQGALQGNIPELAKP